MKVILRSRSSAEWIIYIPRIDLYQDYFKESAQSHIEVSKVTSYRTHKKLQKSFLNAQNYTHVRVPQQDRGIAS